MEKISSPFSCVPHKGNAVSGFTGALKVVLLCQQAVDKRGVPTLRHGAPGPGLARESPVVRMPQQISTREFRVLSAHAYASASGQFCEMLATFFSV